MVKPIHTKQGFADKVFHLHIRIVGDNDEIYFRDYLIENGDIAKRYEKLKLNFGRNLSMTEMGILMQKVILSESTLR